MPDESQWLVFMYLFRIRAIFLVSYFLTLEAPTPQNGQTHSNNLSAKADELFECV